MKKRNYEKRGRKENSIIVNVSIQNLNVIINPSVRCNTCNNMSLEECAKCNINSIKKA